MSRRTLLMLDLAEKSLNNSDVSSENLNEESNVYNDLPLTVNNYDGNTSCSQNIDTGYIELDPVVLSNYCPDPESLVVDSNILIIDGEFLDENSVICDDETIDNNVIFTESFINENHFKDTDLNATQFNNNLSNVTSVEKRDSEDSGENYAASIKRKEYPLKDTPGKKRVRNEKLWKSTIAKEKRNLGMEYTSRKNSKTVKAREMKVSCKEKNCRLKCYEKISEDQRLHIFKKFWLLGDHNRHYDFIAKHVKKMPKSVKTTNKENSRRENSLVYSFTVGNNVLKVCKTFFLNTLDVNDMWVRTTMKKLDNSGFGVGSPDNRGHFTEPKLSEKLISSICEHIDSFPRTESHYTRKDSNKEYLQVDVQSLQQMYRLYTEKMKDKKPIATLRQYREVFNKKYNIAFFLPKKDQCELCDKFLIATDTEKIELETKNEIHLRNKEAVRKLKDADKERADIDKTFITACYDLQKVLITPFKDVSVFYYKLKYSTYNFTIFDIGQSQGYCYIWHEIVAKRGANEIGSCVLRFIEQKCESGCKDFVFYSDNCSGQNRNRYVFAMYSYASSKYKCNIVHRFLEKGHTQCEGDSMHALIERNKKGKVIYTPDQWILLIKLAKKSKPPYEVHEVSQKEIMDLKLLVDKTRNWSKNNKGETVKWSEVREVKIEAENPDMLQLKYDFCDINAVCTIKLESKLKRNQNSVSTLKQAYNKPIPIALKKYQHLQFLCKHGIPEPYHEFYKSLPHVNNTKSSDSEED